MPLLATRTVHRAFLGDGWGLKRAMEASRMVNSCLTANRARVRADARARRAQRGK
jgi:hypothetical protein